MGRQISISNILNSFSEFGLMHSDSWKRENEPSSARKIEATPRRLRDVCTKPRSGKIRHSYI